MPVRSMIHWSLVWTIFSRSALVRIFLGTAAPVPMIFDRFIAASALDRERFARVQVRDRGLDLLRQPLPGELRGEANGVLDGLGARPAVADDDAALHAEHRRSPVLGVVEPRLEPPEGGPRQQEPDGRFERALDLVAQQLLD